MDIIDEMMNLKFDKVFNENKYKVLKQMMNSVIEDRNKSVFHFHPFNQQLIDEFYFDVNDRDRVSVVYKRNNLIAREENDYYLLYPNIKNDVLYKGNYVECVAYILTYNELQYCPRGEI